MTVKMGLTVFLAISQAEARTWVKGLCVHVKYFVDKEMVL